MPFGPMTWRAITRSAKPGANASMRASIRRATSATSASVSGRPVWLPDGSSRSEIGTWV